jgi:hypothetical protein
MCTQDYYPAPYPSKANVEALHKAFDLFEDVTSTHPCEEEYEILGSTVAQRCVYVYVCVGLLFLHNVMHSMPGPGVSFVSWRRASDRQAGARAGAQRCVHCEQTRSS